MIEKRKCWMRSIAVFGLSLAIGFINTLDLIEGFSATPKLYSTTTL
jgi:hypothetical protein